MNSIRIPSGAASALTGSWLTGIRDERRDGALTFTRIADAEDIPVDEASLVLTAEQSNTSLMYADTAILKVFRRLQPGENPDIEIHAALTERGARHVAKLLGAVFAELDGQTYALAMLQEFMTTATDGWELAKASVRDLMAEADLHAEWRFVDDELLLWVWRGRVDDDLVSILDVAEPLIAAAEGYRRAEP